MIAGNKILILEENGEVDSSGQEETLNHTFRSDERLFLNQVNGLALGRLIIDKAAYTVYLEGTRISFPKKEFELLLLLASNPRKVFKRAEILQKIWGTGYQPKDSRSLDVHIRMLRKKLNDNFITTIRGVGYKLEK